MQLDMVWTGYHWVYSIVLLDLQRC